MSLCFTMVISAFAQMSDSQVMSFIARESRAGTSQSQIVTKLMQRGVQIEQIRRIRNQYDAQVQRRGTTAAADGAVSMKFMLMQKKNMQMQSVTYNLHKMCRARRQARECLVMINSVALVSTLSCPPLTTMYWDLVIKW